MTIDLETTGRQLLIDVRVTGACMQLVPVTQMCSERVELFLEKFYKGPKGNDGVGISNFELISVVDKVKTYRMSFTNSTYVDIPITDGEDGKTAYEYAVEGGYTGAEAEFTLLFNSIDDHISNTDIHHTTEALKAAFEPKNDNIQEHISNSDIHVSETQKTNIDKLDLSSELASEETIDETNDKIVIWNNSVLKAIFLGWTRLKTWIGTYFFAQGGNSFGAKQIIGSKDNQDFGIKTNNVERVTVTKEGYVNIGTNGGYDTKTRFFSDVANSYYEIVNYGNYGGIYSYGINNMLFANGYNNLGYIVFSTNRGGLYSTRLYIANNGRITINQSETIAPKAQLDINGGCKIGDDTDAASADKVGTFRYRATASASFCEMCMQTGASTYNWVVIKTNTW